MPTALKTPSSELRRLQQDRDKLHARVREAKAKIAAWDEETAHLRGEFTVHGHAHPEQYEGADKRVKPGTEAAKLRSTIRERLRDNPHRAAYGEAFAPYEGADLALRRFKREHVRERLGELDPDYDKATDTIREGLELLRRGCEEYRVAVEGARAIVLDTPLLNGQHLGHDPRPDEWRRLAADALDSEIAKPGLTPTAEAKLDA
jgi:hypothetical protein